MIKLRRVYEGATGNDGERFLVERLWPRGVTREAARLADWLKDVAPSPALRTWYGHEPARWAEFQRRYEAELGAPEKAPLLRRLRDAARRGTVTLVFAARDTERNSAALLKRVLEGTRAVRAAAERPARRRS